MEKLIQYFEESGALLKGHFLLSSGLHSDGYVQCAKLLQYPDKAEKVVAKIVEKLKKDNIEADLVVGPALGGIIVAYELGRQLGIPAMFAERNDEGEMVLRRGFKIEPGTKVLMAEDVITTGKSTKEAMKPVEEMGGEVIAFCTMVDRIDRAMELPLYSAIKLKINTFEKSKCPLCKLGDEAIKPGSRKIK
ncbi:MAG: orotate phosphoribosyltransferase [Tissierellia bacterium]|nr:orotate phosphoribosyltransferase [Tissierellia bacterium]